MKIKEFCNYYDGCVRFVDVDYPFTWLEFDLTTLPFNDRHKFNSKPFSPMRQLDILAIEHCEHYCKVIAFGVADFMRSINYKYYVAKE